MDTLQIFDYQNSEVRTVLKDGEPWFVLKDVCAVFGETNYRRVSARLDYDEKGVSQVNTPGGIQNMITVNESGLYASLFAMQPEKARGVSDEYIAERREKLHGFRKWVTSEVLPSIRKHGAYITLDKIDEILSDPDMIIHLATILKTEREKNKALETENAQQKQMLSEYRPKASYYDVVLQTKDVLSIGKIAKDYGKSAQWLNEYLHDKGIQYKQGHIWLLYQKYAEQGYTKSKTHTYIDEKGEQHSSLHTYWTQKGRLFIYDLLKRDGMLPLMEQKSAS